MVDELTQESFQTGKAIVTVSVDLITAIADACKRSEQQNPGMSEEQKETLLGKVVDKVMSNYKETHGSLKGFNRQGKEVMSADFVNNSEINMDDVETLSRFSPYFRCRQMQSTRYYLIYAVRHRCDQSQPETFTLY